MIDPESAAEPSVRLTVRGTEPHTFYSLLNEAFTGIVADRYPGLTMRQMLPCPCAEPGEPDCATEFAYSDAMRMLERERSLQCNTSGELIEPRMLILGLRPLPVEQVLAQMNQRLEALPAIKDALTAVAVTTSRTERTNLLILDRTRDLRVHRDEQGSHCPGIFTVTKIGRTTYELQLYCEQPDAPHPLPDGAGVYRLTRFPSWLRRYAPYLRALLTALKYAVPLAKPILTGVADLTLPEVDTARLELATALLNDLPSLPDGDSGEVASSADPSTPDFAALRKALIALDPEREWGGLRERELPESRSIAYLCHHHRQALHYPAHPEPEAPDTPK